MKWHNFKPDTPGNRQKLPPEKKYVLVRLKHPDSHFPDPVVVGYLKFHGGERSQPYFITPGVTIYTIEENRILGDGRVLQWCDCLPDDFEWCKEE